MKNNKSKMSCNGGFPKNVILNSFQDLHRFKSGSKEEALNKGAFRAPLRSGFTLIELLVVVLIIGILAAVAVPMYQRAVMKSRFANLKNIVSSIAIAQEAYYLANGEYSGSVEKLDISVPAANWNTYHEYSYDWGECQIYDSVVLCVATPSNLYYQIRYKFVEDAPNTRGCGVMGSFNPNSPQSKICAQETGKSQPDVTEDTYSFWFYD